MLWVVSEFFLLAVVLWVVSEFFLLAVVGLQGNLCLGHGDGRSEQGRWVKPAPGLLGSVGRLYGQRF